MPFSNLITYEDFQALGRDLTKQIALAESGKEWQEVDDLLREKDGINQWLKDLKDQDQ
jgi:hypothetical protein